MMKSIIVFALILLMGGVAMAENRIDNCVFDGTTNGWINIDSITIYNTKQYFLDKDGYLVEMKNPVFVDVPGGFGYYFDDLSGAK